MEAGGQRPMIDRDFYINLRYVYSRFKLSTTSLEESQNLTEELSLEQLTQFTETDTDETRLSSAEQTIISAR